MSKEIKIHDLVSATGGTLHGTINLEETVSGVLTDSRDSQLKGSAFVCLSGEKFDGHNFIEEVARKGVKLAIVEKKIDSSLPYLLVSNTADAYMKIAEDYRKKINPFVMGVIGSCGKTTTKDLISHLLSQNLKREEFIYTEKNFNNTVGVPKTIFNMTSSTRYLLLEMGINWKGEMDKLSKCARADLFVITGFGQDHLEFLETEEGVIEENLKAFNYGTSKALLFADSNVEVKLTKAKVELSVLNEHSFLRLKKIRTDWQLWNTEVTIELDGRTQTYILPLMGEHNVRNSLLAIAACHKFLKIPFQSKSFENFVSTEHRNKIIPLSQNRFIYDDSYNANPTSMGAMRKLFETCPKKVLYILGGMKELGVQTEKFHGEILKEFKDKTIYCVGSEWKSFQVKNYFPKVEDISTKQLKDLGDFDFIVLKGSRSIGLDRLIPILQGSHI